MGEKMKWRSCMENTLPVIGMVSAMTALAVNLIISKIAMSNGMNNFVLSVYSNALATLILFPCGFLFHRSTKRPPLSFPILCRIFLLALFGCLAETGSYIGIKYSSPTLGTALLNAVPAFTYILAIICRMEGLDLRRPSDISKSLGTIISIAGASIVTFYSGPAIINKPLTSDFTIFLFSSRKNWILGGIILAGAAFFTAAWCILQASILKMYPAEMIVVAFYCLFVTIQSAVVSLIAQTDISAWTLRADIGLFAVVYAGIIHITYRLYMMSWCLTKRGPLFVSLFNPLTIVISVVIGVIFFRDVLYFGSLLGAFILVIGFYGVIWGKANEGKTNQGGEANYSESLDYQVPFLQGQRRTLDY